MKKLLLSLVSFFVLTFISIPSFADDINTYDYDMNVVIGEESYHVELTTENLKTDSYELASLAVFDIAQTSEMPEDFLDYCTIESVTVNGEDISSFDFEDKHFDVVITLTENQPKIETFDITNPILFRNINRNKNANVINNLPPELKEIFDEMKEFQNSQKFEPFNFSFTPSDNIVVITPKEKEEPQENNLPTGTILVIVCAIVVIICAVILAAPLTKYKGDKKLFDKEQKNK